MLNPRSLFSSEGPRAEGPRGGPIGGPIGGPRGRGAEGRADRGAEGPRGRGPRAEGRYRKLFGTISNLFGTI